MTPRPLTVLAAAAALVAVTVPTAGAQGPIDDPWDVLPPCLGIKGGNMYDMAAWYCPSERDGEVYFCMNVPGGNPLSWLNDVACWYLVP